MKRTSRRRCNQTRTEPTPDQIRQYMRCLAEEHQVAWHEEVMSSAPHWVYLLALHLRMVELEHMEPGAGELL